MENRRQAIQGLLTVAALLLTLLAARADEGDDLIAHYGLYPDFATTYRVQMIGARLKLADDLPEVSFQVINSDDLNAEAFPDGHVFITSRMATEVTDPELAFILGHELTHVKEQHAVKLSEQSEAVSILSAVVIAVAGGSDSTVENGSDISGALAAGHYSREDENSADEGGVRLMTMIGYDPHDAAKAMQRLLDAYGSGDANIPIIGWFADHPDTRNRIQHLNDLADELTRNPPPLAPPATSASITLDPSSQHAVDWAPDYLATLITAYCGGSVLGAPGPRLQTPGPPGPPPPKIPGIKYTPTPLKPVVVTFPALQIGYTLTLTLNNIPAGGAPDFASAMGTAVMATLAWQETATGFTGTVVGVAQCSEYVPWMAHEELKDGSDIQKLDDGRHLNIEGTLEGKALQRAARAFTEIVAMHGPVHHVTKVTVPRPGKQVRVGDCVAVFREGLLASEIIVDSVDERTITGTVLWGTHTWQRGDKVALES